MSTTSRPPRVLPRVLRGARPRIAAAALGAALVVLVGSLALAPPASAAPQGACDAPGLKTATREATAVFVGTVESATSRKRAGGGTEITHRVQVSGVWKGGSRITSDQVSVVTESGTRTGCGLGRLPDGARFVFFADRYPRATGESITWRVARDDGTTPARAKVTDSLDRIYGAAKPPVPPKPTPATFTPVDTAAPLSTGRAAAPGAALVLLGLLGLFVVRRVNRA